MVSAVIPLLGALIAGCVHALEIDHMAAVTAFVSRRPHPLRAFGFGVRWALGHSLAILVAGGGLLALRLRPPPTLVTVLEAGVGVMLVGLGVWVMAGAAIRGGRTFERRERRKKVTAPAPASRSVRPHGSGHGHATTWVGAAHGLAGTAGLLALIPAATLASPLLAGAYLALFGIGTMLAMGLYAAGAGLVLHRVNGGVQGFDQWARIGAGAASAAVGIAWLLGSV